MFKLLWILFYLHQSYGYIVMNAEENATLSDRVEYVLLDQTHPCTRTCVKGAAPMVCRYNFVLEWYQTLSKACYDCPFNTEDCNRKHCIPGDGHKRPVIVVNRQIPGPTVEVCLGDEIVVDVENHLMGDTTTIHWHGFHQHGTPYMDGVPFVTQCPILPGTTFRYNFVALNGGTHFWHSHTGMQRADGAFGPFVVRTPQENNPHYDLYDFDLREHIMVILDWGQEPGLTKFIAHHHSDGDNKPATLLVNGHGRYRVFANATHTNTSTYTNETFSSNSTTYTPTARFSVKQGFRYRFRIINAEFLNCPIEVSVDNHTITVISSDGNDVQPVEAESVVTYAGERFDFILNANQPKDLYWIRFRGLMDCDERFRSAHQVAVLQYDGMSTTDYPEGDVNYNSSHREGLQVNALNTGSSHNGTVSMPELISLNQPDKSLKKIPDLKYFVSYDFYKIDNPHFHVPNLYGFHNVTDKKQQLLTPQLNHITLKLQPFPLLSQRDQLTPNQICNETTVRNCDTKFCECTHIVHIKLGSVVEMILIDKGFVFDANHPFHLHGHSFRVVAMERIGSHVTLQEIEERDKKGLLKRNLANPPLKDTVTVPDGGYTIIRFVASNPGYWLFHCHIDFHAELGMAIVFKFGEDEEMPRIPQHFPKCGNYLEEYHVNEAEEDEPDSHRLESLVKPSSGVDLTGGKYYWIILHIGVIHVLLHLV